MLSTDTRTVEAASRILAKRWALSNAAASAAVADIAEETGVEVADLAALIVAAAPLPEDATAGRLVADAATGSADWPGDIEPGWDGFITDLERRVLSLGADGLSLGLVNGPRLHTFNRGFSERTSAVYATISSEANLPGPATLRSSEAQYFRSHESVGARYPKSVGILAGTPFSAAACLPLVLEGERAAFGYLAMHFRGERRFDDRYRAELCRAAAATTRAIHLLVSDTQCDDQAGEGDPSLGKLRSEPTWLREAMKTRAEIEQAKGMLMERFALDDDQSWNLMRRMSNETKIKVDTIAHALVHRVALPGLPQDERMLLTHTSTAHISSQQT